MSDLWIPSRSLPERPAGAIGAGAHAVVARSIAALPAEQRRADAGTAHDTTSLAYRAWLHGQVRQLRADSIPQGMTEQAAREAMIEAWRPRMPAARRRADATNYYALELVDRAAAPVRQPLISIDLLGAIPVSNVDVSKTGWTVKTLKSRASVEARTPGKSTVPMATTVADESGIYPMHVFHTGYMSGGDWRQRQIAGSLSYSPEAENARACEYALDRFLSGTWLVSGAEGLQSFHLGNLPCNRVTSTSTYGTTAFDTLAAELTGYLQRQRQTWKGSRGSGVTLRALLSERIVDALSRYSNFAAGGSGLVTRATILDWFVSNGYQPTMVHELEDLGGADVDGMVLFADGLPDDSGLVHKMSLRPAPVDTYTVGRQEITEYAAISGGLSLTDRDSCTIVEIPVVPAASA